MESKSEKLTRIFLSSASLNLFLNVRKEVSSDGSVVTVFYYNGDMKESHRSGLVRYLYSDTGTWLTTHPDGREVTHFSNGQTEVREGFINI